MKRFQPVSPARMPEGKMVRYERPAEHSIVDGQIVGETETATEDAPPPAEPCEPEPAQPWYAQVAANLKASAFRGAFAALAILVVFLLIRGDGRNDESTTGDTSAHPMKVEVVAPGKPLVVELKPDWRVDVWPEELEVVKDVWSRKGSNIILTLEASKKTSVTYRKYDCSLPSAPRRCHNEAPEIARK